MLLKGINPDKSSCCHVVVLKSDRPIRNGKITVRNSLAGETVFGKVQASEHEVECKVTKIPKPLIRTAQFNQKKLSPFMSYTNM